MHKMHSVAPVSGFGMALQRYRFLSIQNWLSPFHLLVTYAASVPCRILFFDSSQYLLGILLILCKCNCNEKSHSVTLAKDHYFRTYVTPKVIHAAIKYCEVWTTITMNKHGIFISHMSVDKIDGSHCLTLPPRGRNKRRHRTKWWWVIKCYYGCVMSTMNNWMGVVGGLPPSWELFSMSYPHTWQTL